MSVPRILFLYSVQLRRRRQAILKGPNAMHGVGILGKRAILCDDSTISGEASRTCEKNACTPADLDYWQVTTNDETATPVDEGRWQLLRAEAAELLEAPPLSIQE